MVFLDGMKDIMVPIDQAGSIVLPKEVRQELAIKPGDTFKVSIDGSSVTLTPHKEATGFVRKGKALVFTTGEAEILTAKDVRSMLEDTRVERDCVHLLGSSDQKHRA
jgi:AbrB family looped-hinge helix DNA binding protein